MAPIPFAGQLTEAQFRQMQWLTTHWLLRYLGWILLFGFLSLLPGAYPMIVRDPLGQALRAIPGIAFMVFFLVGPPLMIRRQWRTNELIKKPVSGRADEAGIEWNSEFVAAKFPWAALQKSRQAPGLIVVYTAPNSALYFPRSFFADRASWQQFRDLVSSRVPSK